MLAKKSGINVWRLRYQLSRMHDNAKLIQSELTNNKQLAKKLQLVGTPAFILADQSLTHFVFIPGAIGLSQLQHKIDQFTAMKSHKSKNVRNANIHLSQNQKTLQNDHEHSRYSDC